MGSTSFTLTKKKLLQQPPQGQRKLVADWARRCYLAECRDELNSGQRKSILCFYRQVLAWLGESPESQNGIQPNSAAPNFAEFFADEFHRHLNHAHEHKAQGNERTTALHESEFLPEANSPDRLLNEEWQPRLNWRVALENVRSGFNVGSIIRSVDAAGWHSVILGGYTPPAEHKAVRKTAKGAQDWIPCRPAADLHSYLQQSSLPKIGLETLPESPSLFEYDWPEEGILVLGNEEYGLRRSTLRCCDAVVRIPQYGRKNSLNIAAAFALTACLITEHYSQQNKHDSLA